MKIYAVSSWRNAYQQTVVHQLREAGHEVYDFKNPKEGDRGFRWSDVGLERVDSDYCTGAELKKGLAHPRAVEGFGYDFGAMKWADACVLILPCGRSAHLEAGWMAGAGKLTYVLTPCHPSPELGQLIEPELMYGLLGGLCLSMNELLVQLRSK